MAFAVMVNCQGSNPPNYIWGVFSDSNFNQQLQLNITKYNLQTGENTVYPVAPEIGIPINFLSINGSNIKMIAADQVSMSILTLNVDSGEYTVEATMLNSGPIIYNDDGFGFDQATNTLYNTGYISTSNETLDNATLFQWNFETQVFSTIPIVGLDVKDDLTSTGIFNPQTSTYYANLLDEVTGEEVIYCYNVEDQQVSNFSLGIWSLQFSSLIITDNGTLFGITESDDESYAMIYEIDLTTNQANFFFHTENLMIDFSTPAITYGEYILLFTNEQYGDVDNVVTVIDTISRESKVYTIGNGVLPKNIGFLIATSN
ncbi:hypothetical protein DLAC_04721 [Tieghemostelium lacteum]|uniref:Uncharacterized protein n=1 Tax=Tieghemostelium lacteum TaxID=361077 RepID=A0A151ZKI9_TIELA|nr:hypothetical protein DLAC_04721 [Tieghemostelium lacteum]|eukprot:KYQ94425.1 hypothetical protein DLAC_04721 [Tieghemostelium lacteum]